MKHFFIFLSLSLALYGMPMHGFAQKPRMRDYGIRTGVMKPGPMNAITDVKGVAVGHVTLIEGDSIRTGVTAIIPHPGNIYREKVPAAFWAGNGYGKMAGTTQIRELGNIETPVILTNTLSVAAGMEGLITYTLAQKGNENVLSVNAVVGETNDGALNDIRGRHVTPDHVLEALTNARPGPVQEGNVGAGTGTVCFGFKGGIGTSSRVLPQDLGGYTVGVLVQTNFGGVLQIDGINVGERLGHFSYKDQLNAQSSIWQEGPPHAAAIEEKEAMRIPDADGSCMIVIITDAPLGERNLERLAKRGIMGLARTGGIASNGSGDYVIALSVDPENLIRSTYDQNGHVSPIFTANYLHNDQCSPLFMAAIEATEEAILNSLFAAHTITGIYGRTVEALPVEKVIRLFPLVSDVE
jgi:D-aminopeptidase